MNIQTLKNALEALEASIDDVRECLDNLRPHSGWAKYDRRITAYEAQIALHEKAMQDLYRLIASMEQKQEAAA